MKPITWKVEWPVAFGVSIMIIVVVVTIWAIATMRNTPTSLQIIDGCEYLNHFTGRQWELIHKGNCTNSIHLR